MLRFVIIASIVAAPLTAFAGNGTTFLDNNKKTSIACTAGDPVAIVGNQNTIALTGECKHVDISGNENTITIETIGTLSLQGHKNKVTWKTGAGGKTPTLSDIAGDNTITRAK